MTWWMASLMANVSIIYVESVNRVADSWLDVVPQTWWAIIIAQSCLFMAWNGAPSWFMAWVVFVVGNSIMRVASIAVMAPTEVASWHFVMVGVAGMVGSGFLIKQGLH